MSSEKDSRFSSFDQEEYTSVIRRYEDMRQKRSLYFFDVDEFEVIINYYLEDDNSKEANAALRIAEQQHPNTVSLQIKRAELFVEENEPVRALNLLKKLIVLDSSNYEIHLLMGNSYMLLGDTEKANSFFQDAIGLTIDNTEEIAYNIGYAFEKIKLHHIAVYYYEIAYEVNSEERAYLFDIGFCYEQLGQEEKSEENYKLYLEQDPLSDSAWYNLGVVLNKQNKDKEAIDAYDNAVAINTNNTSALFNLANSYANLDEFDSAIDIYLEFLALEPGSSQGNFYLGELYYKNCQMDKAKECFQRSMELDKLSGDGFYGLSLIEYAQKNYSESISLLKDAISKNDENGEYWNLFGHLNKKFEYYENAENSYEKALRLMPENHDTLVHYIDILIEQDKLSEALNKLIDSKDHIKSNSSLLYRFATIYFMLGDKKSALDYLLSGFQIDPKGIADVYVRYPQAKFDHEVKKLLKIYQK